MERIRILKVEGENRLDIESVCKAIAHKYEIADKKALKWFCTALQYNLVMQAIFEQIDFLLDENVLPR